MPTISIIVPVFNVAPYLKKCIDSLINQTFSDIEIILVDDGSTDKSPIICDEYALSDDRVKVIHKQNGGLSDARNAGLDVCGGEYIAFVDGDDYVAHNMYELLYKKAAKYHADVSGCQLVNIFPDHTFKQNKEDVVLYNQIDMIKHIFCVGGSLSVCNKLFKRFIFDDLRFDVGKHYEDAYIVLKWLKKVHIMSIINDGLYYYMHRGDSITGNEFNKKSLDVIYAYKYDLKMIKMLYPSAVSYGELRLYWAYRNVLERILRSRKTEETECVAKEIKKFLWKNLFKIMTNSAIPLKQKVAYVLILLNPQIYMYIKYR